MSRIMSKLKKLEGNVKSNSDEQAIAVGPGPKESGPRGISYNIIGISVTLAVVILVGIIGYLAGIRSGKGAKAYDNASGISATESTQNSRTANTRTSELKNTVAEDLSTITFEEPDTIPAVPAATVSNDRSAEAQKIIAVEPVRLGPDKPAGYADTGDGEKVMALTAAIIKATDNPLTPEEDEFNKETIQKLNVLGILKDEKGMTAIISGTEVREGDKIRQFIVDEITKDYVVLSFKRTLYKKTVR